MLELAFRPDRSLGSPVYRQLADYLSDLIGSERLDPGQRLPATRDLAASLGVGRNTAMLAYDALEAAGLVSSHVGRGTFVTGRRPARRAAAQDGRTDPTHLSPGSDPDRDGARDRGALAWSGLFALRTNPLRFPLRFPLPGRGADPIRVDLRPGRVCEATLPAAELSRAQSRALQRHLGALANDMDPLGWPPLRAALARALVARGIACDEHDILVTAGAQQALDLVARTLIDPGDTVCVEQPGYFGATLAFRSCEAHLIGLSVDREGVRTDELARLMRSRRVKLVYTTPSAQTPTGVRLSEERRQTLLELCQREQTPILEDDYDAELRIGGRALPALKTGDTAGQVIYVGTFSKSVFPGMRVGYVVGAPRLLQMLARARLTASLQPSALDQAALAELCASGDLDRHVRRLRRDYGLRRDAMLAALTEHMPDDAHWSEPAGGTLVWLELPLDVDAGALERRARAAGIHFGRGDAFFLDPGGPPTAALSFATATPREIAEGIAELGQLIGALRPIGAGRTKEPVT